MHTTTRTSHPRPTPTMLGGTGRARPLGAVLPAAPPARPADPATAESVRLEEGRLSFGMIARRLGWDEHTDLLVERHPRHLVVRVADAGRTAPVPVEPVRLGPAPKRRLRLPKGFHRSIGLRSGDIVLAFLDAQAGCAHLYPAWAFAPAREMVEAGELDAARIQRLEAELAEQRRLTARLAGTHQHH